MLIGGTQHVLSIRSILNGPRRCPACNARQDERYEWEYLCGSLWYAPSNRTDWVLLGKCTCHAPRAYHRAEVC